MIDTDPWLPTVMKRSSCASLFAPSGVIAGKRDAGNCWAAGRYTTGRDLWKDKGSDAVRRQIEGCDSLHAVVVFHSVCGGTGSGLTDLVLEDIGTLAPKAHRITQSTIPSPNLPASNLEHYNAVMGIGTALLLQAHVASCVQTEAVHTLCKQVMGDDAAVSTAAINRVSAATMNMLHLPLRTASLRLGRSIFDLRDFLDGHTSYKATTLVAPGIAWGAADDLPEVTARAMAPHGSLVVPMETAAAAAAAALTGKAKDSETAKTAPNMSTSPECVAWSFAGNVEPRQASAALKAAANSSTRFGAVSMVHGATAPEMASSPSRDVCVATIAKTPALAASLRCTLHRFHSLYASRAYAHWFVSEGMEEGEFAEAAEGVLRATRALEGGNDEDSDE
jgi:tubulin alpha